jgi:hypothetical protein
MFTLETKSVGRNIPLLDVHMLRSPATALVVVRKLSAGSLFDTRVNSLLWELKDVLSNVTYVELLYTTIGGRGEGSPFLIYICLNFLNRFFVLLILMVSGRNHVLYVLRFWMKY